MIMPNNSTSEGQSNWGETCLLFNFHQVWIKFVIQDCVYSPVSFYVLVRVAYQIEIVRFGQVFSIFIANTSTLSGICALMELTHRSYYNSTCGISNMVKTYPRVRTWLRSQQKLFSNLETVVTYLQWKPWHDIVNCAPTYIVWQSECLQAGNRLYRADII